ncbi:MAG: phosphotransferase [Actinomycetota bacterium]|nr:phosphotransferase [Actinomycetota bacterium]
MSHGPFSGARATRPSWGSARAALSEGLDIAGACAAGGLRRHDLDRLTGRWAGAWADLFDGVDGARLLMIDESPGSAAVSFAETAAVVGFADTDHARAAFRLELLAGRGAEVTVGPEQQQRDRPGGWDLIILDGTVRRPNAPATVSVSRLASLARVLAPGGRVVVVADNRLSPVRAGDRLRGRSAGPVARSLRSVERLLARAGLSVRQEFALLRSSISPVTSFDLHATQATSAVLAAAGVRCGPSRLVALRALESLARHGLARLVVPAWLVIASADHEPWEPAADRPTGRIGYDDSEDAQVLRGEPPLQLEKRYGDAGAAQHEAMALEALERAGVDGVPRLAGPVALGRARQTWLPGTPLVAGRLRGDELERWVAEAARALGSMHRSTRRPDGKVLVHGDFWLGNLLVQGNSVCGVVDWTDCSWGESDADLDHLVATLVESGVVAPERAERLAVIVRQAHEATYSVDHGQGTGAEGKSTRAT